MTDKHIIVGIHVTNRAQRAGDVQKVFTEYGCNIKTRLGLHEVHDNVCAPNGLIVLEMHGEEPKCNEMIQKLKGIPGIEVQKMVFGH
ncbi:MAG TPA: hypothetical protein PKK06_00655 [Phycisphaerae bacterium]|nr:hypothetical protein [Phycisphaerae bacterium]HNU43881.1 hypothetical protein [Phycisphaerae bacterium]